MLLYVSAGSHLGSVQVFVDESGRPQGDFVEAGGAAVLSTKRQEGKFVALAPSESVLQVFAHPLLLLLGYLGWT